MLAGCAADQTIVTPGGEGLAPVVDVIALNGNSGNVDVSQPVQVQVIAANRGDARYARLLGRLPGAPPSPTKISGS